MWKLTDRFRVRTTGGQEIEIEQYTNFIDSTGTGGADLVEGLKRFQTAKGEAVNGAGLDEYEIITPRGSVRARRI